MRRVVVRIVRVLLVSFALTAAAGWVRFRVLSADRRVAPELPAGLTWINSDRSLRLNEELKGHVVLLEFWTQGCINCEHAQRDLARLEATYARDAFVIIGVHSAKFSGERDDASIRHAVARIGIEHPVVVDTSMRIWNSFGIGAWPSYVLIGADGRIAPIDSRFGTPQFGLSGEGRYAVLDRAIARELRAARRGATLATARTPVPVKGSFLPGLDGLAYPGKAICHLEPGERGGGYVFVADTRHHRVIIVSVNASESGDLSAGSTWVVGDGAAGRSDGPAATARFQAPQGLAYDASRRTLYVADTGNDAIRAIDVSRLDPSEDRWSAGAAGLTPPRSPAGSECVRTVTSFGQPGERDGLDERFSPWDLVLAPGGEHLFVALAVRHEIWRVEAGSGAAGAFAGSGEEALRDGRALDAALAQPSGLGISSGGDALVVADAESSAIRRIDVATARVTTIVGHGLFDYGDASSDLYRSRFQHPLGVAWSASSDHWLYVADTYNDTVKRIDLNAGRVSPSAGGGRHARREAGVLALNRPGGVFAFATAAGERLLIADTNHHRVIVLDPAAGPWHELPIRVHPESSTPNEGADGGPPMLRVLRVRTGATLRLDLVPPIPAGEIVADSMALGVRIVRESDDPAARGEIVRESVNVPAFPVRIEVPGSHVVAGERWRVHMTYATCAHGEGAVCTPRSVTWVVELHDGEAKAFRQTLDDSE